MRNPLLLASLGALLCCSPKAATPSESPVTPSGVEVEKSPPEPADAGSPAALPLGGGDWPQYRCDPRGTWANPGRFTADQGARVELAWTAALGSYGWTQPVRRGDTVFVTMGFSGKVAALDASTGKERWSRTLDHVFTVGCDPQEKHTGFFAAPAVDGDTVYVASPDGNLYALDASDGTTRWSVKVADPSNRAEFVQSSPSVSRELNRVYLGVGATYHCEPVESRIMAVDLTTHAVQAKPLHAPGVYGGSVWSSIAVDEDVGRIFVTTGDPAGSALSTAAYAQSIIAFDAQTLEVLDHWQNPGPGPNDNEDFGASATLFEAGGRNLLAAPTKEGMLYVLDRDHLAAGPVWTYRLAIPGDPMQGKGSIASPTFTHGLLLAAGGTTPDGKPGSVVALDPATGTVKWRHDAPGFVLSAMPACGDVVAVASSRADFGGSALELLEIDSGRVLKSFTNSCANCTSLGAPTISNGSVLWLLFPGELRSYRIPE